MHFDMFSACCLTQTTIASDKHELMCHGNDEC